ncbi:hypothetical protein SBRY_10028 [Actinacidiphila bryophytorum]|uniref:Uncharacterized protein n=1 Tax=Actinacidiphila bryophytorum TaxID=1436133 RepID=A0A9W4EC54_9ACTN|nr:hypothetical protein SBRY_10028 [Actinacidiphila bryophytorum]
MITAPATTTPTNIRCVRVKRIAATRDPSCRSATGRPRLPYANDAPVATPADKRTDC